MSSAITHIVFGGAIGSSAGSLLGQDRRALTLWGFCLGFAPDLDIIGFAYGVPYESFFGHRGFFHAPFLGLLLASVVLALVWRVTQDSRRAVAWAFATVAAFASHAVLDALTTGGAGVMMFYPLSEERFFFDWRPIPVSPIGIRAFLTERGLRVMRVEVFWIAGAFLCAAIAALLARFGSTSKGCYDDQHTRSKTETSA